MTARPGFCGGVVNLQGILDRCRVDDETGCWIWMLGASSSARHESPIPMTTLRGKTVTAMRAAWLLSGRELAPGQVVWRNHCGNSLCCNPDHAKSGTRTEMRNACAASGRERGLHRQIANRPKHIRSALPVAVVREVEQLLRDGALQREVVAKLSVSKDTVCRIATGKHMHSSKRPPVVPAASVFAWGRA